MASVLSFVLAGGEGKRLMPLTLDRAKPAVPFGGHYRLVDFVLSNLANAGFLRIIVLTQYKSHSLDLHISRTWRLSPMLGQFVSPVPAQMRLGQRWFAGSADAVYQNLNIVTDFQPDYICVFGADHIYRMDPRQMLDQHIQSGAAVTVAGIRAPVEESDKFGVIEADESGWIRRFVEKPERFGGLADDPNVLMASMGNYIFTTDALVDALRADANAESSAHDMGGDLIPSFVRAGDARLYDFSKATVPGVTGRDARYWRDVGTLDSYYDAQMDLVSVHPVFNLYNSEWPILTSVPSLPPAKFVFDEEGRRGQAIDSLISLGVINSGATVRRSVISPGVALHSGAVVEDSVIMDDTDVGPGAVVRHAIVDKAVRIEAGATLGVDPERDRALHTISDGGVVVVGKGARVTKK